MWAQPFLEEEDADLRADLAVCRAVARTDGNDLRPTGDRTIGASGAYQAKLNRAVRSARPSYPFSQRTWYQVLPENVRADPWITPLCQRLARLERAGLPVTDYIKQALATDPSPRAANPTPPRPRGRCPTSSRPRRCGGVSFLTSGRLHSAPTSTPRTCCSPHGAPR